MSTPSSMNGGFEREALPLALIVLLLPFEPRRAFQALGLEFTLLEAAAGTAILVLALMVRARLRERLRRPPLPVLALMAFAAAHLLSAALAPDDRAAALKFALRMVALAGSALVVSALPPRAVRQASWAWLAAGLLVAVLAVGEAFGGARLDPILALFREMPFNVGGVRRASAGSEYPNLAAACLMYAWLFTIGLFGQALRPAGAVAASALFAAGLLFTYSRGALLATAVGLLALALANVRRVDGRIPVAALGVLMGGFGLFSARAEAFQLRLESEGVGSWYGAAYEPEARQITLKPFEGIFTSVRVTNTGRRTWRVDRAFHLSYHWYDPTRQSLADGGRTDLPRDLAPGESAVLTAEVRAPEREGHYLLVWDMVQEATSWFSGQGVEPAVVPAVISSAATPVPEAAAHAPITAAHVVAASTPGGPPAAPPLAPWRPGRGELWRLALDMWRERPLVGFGSDRFRRIYGARAGHPFWDTRVFANNTFLETAATTGLLGLASLAAALIAAARAAARARRSCSAVDRAVGTTLLALTAAIACHGLVDYVLAFTGHYLLLGIVVGAAAGLPREPAVPPAVQEAAA